MDLARKFEEATSSTTTNINSLETHKLYPIVRAQRVTIRFDLTVLKTVRVSESSVFQIFLPKR